MPSRSQPRSTQASIAATSSARRASTSAAPSQATSFSRIRVDDRQAGLGAAREQLGRGVEDVGRGGGVSAVGRGGPGGRGRRRRSRRRPSSRPGLTRGAAGGVRRGERACRWGGAAAARGGGRPGRAPGRRRPRGPPSRRIDRAAVTRATRPGMASTSTVAGSSPSSPSTTARSEPWPLPVWPSDPNSSALTAHTSAPASASTRSAKRRAARIGPTVCELDGPMPILKTSNVLRAAGPSGTRSTTGSLFTAALCHRARSGRERGLPAGRR